MIMQQVVYSIVAGFGGRKAGFSNFNCLLVDCIGSIPLIT